MSDFASEANARLSSLQMVTRSAVVRSVILRHVMIDFSLAVQMESKMYSFLTGQSDRSHRLVLCCLLARAKICELRFYCETLVFSKNKWAECFGVVFFFYPTPLALSSFVLLLDFLLHSETNCYRCQLLSIVCSRFLGRRRHLERGN